MSTTDPIAARRERERSRIGSASAAAGIVVGLVLLIVAGVLLGYGMSGFAAIPPEGTDDPPLRALLGFVGIPLTVAGLLVHLGSARRFTGRLVAAPGVGPGTVLLAGGAIGTWFGVAGLGDAGLLWIVPVVLTLLAAAAAITGALARRARRARRTTLDLMLRAGRIVRGEIVEIPEIDPSSGGLLGTVTVRFDDASGTRRWVTKSGQWPKAGLPKTGDPAAVLFDPAYPSDERRIWLGPDGSSTAADFARWSA